MVWQIGQGSGERGPVGGAGEQIDVLVLPKGLADEGLQGVTAVEPEAGARVADHVQRAAKEALGRSSRFRAQPGELRHRLTSSDREAAGRWGGDNTRSAWSGCRHQA